MPAYDKRELPSRWFRSAYLADPVVYLQKHDRWLSYAPGGDVREEMGRLTDEVLSQAYPVTTDQDWDLVNLRLKEAAASQVRPRRQLSLPASRRRRDKLLGLAMLVMAIRGLIEVAGYSGLAASGYLTSAIFSAVAMLVMAAGYLLAGMALLGPRPIRADRLRIGAYLLLGAYVVLIVEAALVGFKGVLYPVLAAMALFWVSRAFPREAPSSDPITVTARNKLLGQASVRLAIATGLAVIVGLLDFPIGRVSDQLWLTRVTGAAFELGTDIARLVAIVVAARAFFLASRMAGPADPQLRAQRAPSENTRVSRRDGLLLHAATVYVLSGVMAVVSHSIWLHAWASVQNRAAFTIYVWFLWASQIGIVVVGCLAVAAFRFSSRRTRVDPQRRPESSDA